MSDTDLRWMPVGSPDEWQDGRGRVVHLGARRIAVFRTGDRFRALKDSCPHAGVSLAGGRPEGDTVRCPAHAWAFHLDDGRCLSVPTCSATSYPVRVVSGQVEIGLA